MKNNRKPSVQLLPYEELRIQVLGNSQYLLQTPWLSLQTTVNSTPAVHQTLEAFSQQNFDKLNLQILSDFLKQLKLPFCYILPEKDSQFRVDTHELSENSLAGISKKEFRSHLGLKTNPNESLEWSWDVDAILDFAHVGEDLYSPSSILSVVRRFHFLDCAEKDRTSDLYEMCRNSNPSPQMSLQQMLATIVYQNYYVTSKCQESLAPAVDMARAATETLLDFMKDEEGHDLLLMRALTSMSAKVDELYLAQSTQNIMNLLKVSGSLSFLAFCLAIDFFEKPTFAEVDPLAELLSFHGEKIASTCLQKHKSINDGGEHDAIALTLLEPMKPVSREYAIVAMRFSEVLSDEMTSVTQELIQMFNNQPTSKHA